MINTDAGFPPFEGQIIVNPDTGYPLHRHDPVPGSSRPAQAAPQGSRQPGHRRHAAGGRRDGDTGQHHDRQPERHELCQLSSGGPRTGDSWLKPDVTAPGEHVLNVYRNRRRAGSCLEHPWPHQHVAGVAALVKQAHPAEAGPGMESSDRQHGRTQRDQRLDSVQDEPWRVRPRATGQSREDERDRSATRRRRR